MSVLESYCSGQGIFFSVELFLHLMVGLEPEILCKGALIIYRQRSGPGSRFKRGCWGESGRPKPPVGLGAPRGQLQWTPPGRAWLVAVYEALSVFL